MDADIFVPFGFLDFSRRLSSADTGQGTDQAVSARPRFHKRWRAAKIDSTLIQQLTQNMLARAIAPAKPGQRGDPVGARGRLHRRGS